MMTKYFLCLMSTKLKPMFFVFSLTPTRVVPVVGGVSDGEFGIKLFSFSSGHLLLI